MKHYNKLLNIKIKKYQTKNKKIELNNFYLFLFFINFLCKSNFGSQINFEIKSGFCCKEINSFEYQQKSGHIRIFKFLNYAILYDFFILQKFRGKGYGKKLLQYACDYLKNNNVNYIFIQPGPFDIDEKNNIIRLNNDEKEKQIAKLIVLYRNTGFYPVKYFVKKVASIIYKIIGVDEDYEYLMIMEI